MKKKLLLCVFALQSLGFAFAQNVNVLTDVPFYSMYHYLGEGQTLPPEAFSQIPAGAIRFHAYDYSEMQENIKRELAGSVGLELIKKEKFAIGEDAIKRAEDIAFEMVNKYKMAASIEEIIFRVKENLKLELMQNSSEIQRLTNIMIKNEVINIDDF